MPKRMVLNRETGKIELHFEKADYIALSEEQKKELKSAFLWSNYSKAWVSRSKNNHYWAEQVAKKLGFEELEKVGQRLSFAEELERKAEKAEARAERMEEHATNAIKRSENLQKEFNSFHGDISFFTQPNINSSGGRAFTRYRERVFARYERGMQEYRKSEYFKDRSETARATADMAQLRNPVYLDNRIKECNSSIKKLQSNIINYEEKLYRIEQGEVLKNYRGEILTAEQYQNWINETLEKMEYEMDKLAYFENCMEEVSKELEKIGRKVYSKEDIKKGYLVKIRGRWSKVEKVNPKTVEAYYIETPLIGLGGQYPYAEIQEVKIPDNWEEKSEELKNPFILDDILCKYRPVDKSIYKAYQVIKVSNKTIEIKEIKVENYVPVLNSFISDKAERKTVKRGRSGTFIVNDGDWYLYKYEANAMAGAV